MLDHGDAPVQSSEPRRQRILVIDDDPGIRALCAAVLESEGYDVLEAGDGREGLARAVSDYPDLVVCDIAMPVLDGFGLAVALRQNEQTKHLPLVFLTGEHEPSAERHAFDVGALGFFLKPFEPNALSLFIKGALMRQDPGALQLGGHAV